MIDTGKELPDVAWQHVGVVSRQLLGAIQGAMCALADAVGIRIGDKCAFEDGFDKVTERVMDHPVAEGCSRDQPTLGLMNVKAVIQPRLVGIGAQLRLQVEQVIFQAMLEGRDIRLPPLALASAVEGQEEVVPGTEITR